MSVAANAPRESFTARLLVDVILVLQIPTKGREGKEAVFRALKTSILCPERQDANPAQLDKHYSQMVRAHLAPLDSSSTIVFGHANGAEKTRSQVPTMCSLNVIGVRTIPTPQREHLDVKLARTERR